MDTTILLRTLALILASGSPLVFAVIGEILTEKAGVTNLSLDGTILLAAMVGFAVAFVTGSLFLAFLGAMLVGALVAALIAFSSIVLKLDQIAVGFVLTILCADLSTFFGNPFVRIQGPAVPGLPIPILKEIPVIGRLFFDQNMVVYLSFVVVVAGVVVDLQDTAGVETASCRRAAGGGVRARREREPATIYLHDCRRRVGRLCRGVLLIVRQTGLELPRNIRPGVDRIVHRDFRRLASDSRCDWRIYFWCFAVHGKLCAGMVPGCSNTGLSNSAICTDDCRAAIGEQRGD